jgi:ABC-type dipeptide/oligopeptide/nickel transport system permease component
MEQIGTSPPSYKRVQADKRQSRSPYGYAYEIPMLLSLLPILWIGIILLFSFFNRVTAPALAGTTCRSTGLTTVPNAFFFVTRSHNGAATNWTQLLCHLCLPFLFLSSAKIASYIN